MPRRTEVVAGAAGRVCEKELERAGVETGTDMRSWNCAGGGERRIPPPAPTAPGIDEPGRNAIETVGTVEEAESCA